jgi:hypothetical protein
MWSQALRSWSSGTGYWVEAVRGAAPWPCPQLSWAPAEAERRLTHQEQSHSWWGRLWCQGTDGDARLHTSQKGSRWTTTRFRGKGIGHFQALLKVVPQEIIWTLALIQ